MTLRDFLEEKAISGYSPKKLAEFRKFWVDSSLPEWLNYAEWEDKLLSYLERDKENE